MTWGHFIRVELLENGNAFTVSRCVVAVQVAMRCMSVTLDVASPLRSRIMVTCNASGVAPRLAGKCAGVFLCDDRPVCVVAMRG